MNLEKGFLRVEEVAEIFSEKPAKIRRWARERRLKARKVGTRWYFSRLHLYQDKTEGDGAKILGNGAERKPYTHPFDILRNGHRVDVKAQNISYSKALKYHWVFNFGFGGETCDYFLLLCYNQKLKTVVRSYLIPFSVILDNREDKRYRHIMLKIAADSEKFEKYRIFCGFPNPTSQQRRKEQKGQ